jgi:hypothetical protein
VAKNIPKRYLDEVLPNLNHKRERQIPLKKDTFHQGCRAKSVPTIQQHRDELNSPGSLGASLFLLLIIPSSSNILITDLLTLSF